MRQQSRAVWKSIDAIGVPVAPYVAHMMGKNGSARVIMGHDGNAGKHGLMVLPVKLPRGDSGPVTQRIDWNRGDYREKGQLDGDRRTAPLNGGRYWN